MVQPALTERIINTLGLKDERQCDTPADPNVKLHKDTNGLPTLWLHNPHAFDQLDRIHFLGFCS